MCSALGTHHLSIWLALPRGNLFPPPTLGLGPRQPFRGPRCSKLQSKWLFAPSCAGLWEPMGRAVGCSGQRSCHLWNANSSRYRSQAIAPSLWHVNPPLTICINFCYTCYLSLQITLQCVGRALCSLRHIPQGKAWAERVRRCLQSDHLGAGGFLAPPPPYQLCGLGQDPTPPCALMPSSVHEG